MNYELFCCICNDQLPEHRELVPAVYFFADKKTGRLRSLCLLHGATTFGNYDYLPIPRADVGVYIVQEVLES